MRALTLHRPWPWAILYGEESTRKRIENRKIAPPRCVRGQVIALHAGKFFDADSDCAICETLAVPDATPDRPLHWFDQGIVGVARIAGFIEQRGPFIVTEFGATDPDVVTKQFDLQGQERWWRGPYAWILRDVRPLTAPVPIRGMQGVWNVPPDVEAQIWKTVSP